MFRLVQIAVGAAVLSAGSPLLGAEIRFLGDGSCRREREVTEQVESMTARPISSIEIADFELSAKLLPDDQWLVELTTVRRADGARSTRAIHGATCVEVTDAAAVAIALAVGPTESASELGVEPKPSASQQVLAAPAKARRPPANPPRNQYSNQNSLEWFAGLAGNLDSSATPGWAFGASLHLGSSWLPADKRRTQLRFELEGAFYAPSATPSVGGQAGKFQLFYVAPLVCGGKPLGGPTLLLCAGFELGQLSGEGVGAAITSSHPSNTFWSAARAELGLLIPLASSLRVVSRAGVGRAAGQAGVRARWSVRRISPGGAQRPARAGRRAFALARRQIIFDDEQRIAAGPGT